MDSRSRFCFSKNILLLFQIIIITSALSHTTLTCCNSVIINNFEARNDSIIDIDKICPRNTPFFLRLTLSTNQQSKRKCESFSLQFSFDFEGDRKNAKTIPPYPYYSLFFTDLMFDTEYFVYVHSSTYDEQDMKLRNVSIHSTSCTDPAEFEVVNIHSLYIPSSACKHPNLHSGKDFDIPISAGDAVELYDAVSMDTNLRAVFLDKSMHVTISLNPTDPPDCFLEYVDISNMQNFDSIQVGEYYPYDPLFTTESVILKKAFVDKLDFGQVVEISPERNIFQQLFEEKAYIFLEFENTMTNNSTCHLLVESESQESPGFGIGIAVLAVFVLFSVCCFAVYCPIGRTKDFYTSYESSYHKISRDGGHFDLFDDCGFVFKFIQKSKPVKHISYCCFGLLNFLSVGLVLTELVWHLIEWKTSPFIETSYLMDLISGLGSIIIILLIMVTNFGNKVRFVIKKTFKMEKIMNRCFIRDTYYMLVYESFTCVFCCPALSLLKISQITIRLILMVHRTYDARRYPLHDSFIVSMKTVVLVALIFQAFIVLFFVFVPNVFFNPIFSCLFGGRCYTDRKRRRKTGDGEETSDSSASDEDYSSSEDDENEAELKSLTKKQRKGPRGNRGKTKLLKKDDETLTEMSDDHSTPGSPKESLMVL